MSSLALGSMVGVEKEQKNSEPTYRDKDSSSSQTAAKKWNGKITRSNNSV